jgi:hypothetical protein
MQTFSQSLKIKFDQNNPSIMYEIPFAEARDVIDFFLSNEFKTDDILTSSLPGKSGYIFRGQSNSEWPVLPNAFRSNTNWSNFTPQPPNENTQDRKKLLLQTLHAEATSIRLFLDSADTTGITTPVDYLVVQNTIDDLFKLRDSQGHIEDFNLACDKTYPPKDFYRSMALAQHYGVPTRLLDWSESPFVSCYFAAENVSSVSTNTNQNNNMIAIYYFNIYQYNDNWPIDIIKSPRHENSNLLNQKGIFVNFKKANSYFIKHGNWPSLYDFVPEIIVNSVLLPTSKADDLLRLLYDLGITRHTLSPSLYNAARDFEYKRKLFPHS